VAYRNAPEHRFPSGWIRRHGTDRPVAALPLAWLSVQLLAHSARFFIWPKRRSYTNTAQSQPKLAQGPNPRSLEDNLNAEAFMALEAESNAKPKSTFRPQ